MQQQQNPVGGVLVPYQTDIKLGCALSCMAAHIHLTVAKSLLELLLLSVSSQLWFVTNL